MLLLIVFFLLFSSVSSQLEAPQVIAQGVQQIALQRQAQGNQLPPLGPITSKTLDGISAPGLTPDKKMELANKAQNLGVSAQFVGDLLKEPGGPQELVHVLNDKDALNALFNGQPRRGPLGPAPTVNYRGLVPEGRR